MARTLIFLLFFTGGIVGCYGGDSMLSPSFTLDRAGLEKIISDQPEAIQKAILAKPERFLQLADSMLSQPEELFYLVDKQHALTKDQRPARTVKPHDYGIPSTRADREVSALIIEPLKKMTEAAGQEGLQIVFASGYRPYDYQEMIYNRYVKEMGQKEADRVSARPGTSQHQLGTAVDFGTITDDYAYTPEGKWLTAHAGDYGFSLSYPKGMEELTGYKWECWHYRYITVEGVAMQKEFFQNIQQYLMLFWHDHKADLLSARR